MARGARYEHREQGIALVAVLWTVILLSALATALISMSRSDARQLNSESTRMEASFDAEAAINLTIAILSDPRSDIRWDGVPQNIKFGNAYVDISVTAENGKVDLNAADPELISGLLRVVGAGAGAADKIANAIVVVRNPGAPLNWSLGASQSNTRINHGPFTNIEQLGTIGGVTADMLERLIPNITVYSGSPSIDKDFAPLDVLLAIPGNSRADAEATLLTRSNHTKSFNRLGDLSRVNGRAVSINAVASLPNGGIARRNEVIRFTGNAKEPIWILAADAD